MKLLMVSGDRSVLVGKQGAFYSTLEEFSKHWERIDVLCPRPPLPIPVAYPRPEPDGSYGPFFGKVFFHPSRWNLLWQPYWILKKGRELLLMHHHNVTTVHDYPPFYNGIGAAILHRATAVPYALEIHHIVGYPVAESFAEYIGRRMTRTFIRLDAKEAGAVRVVNREVAGILGGWGVPAEKIHIVPSLYLDQQILTPDPTITKEFDIVTGGRLVPNKNIHQVIQAIARFPDLRILIIGDGPERPSLERLVRKLQLQRRVTFTGWLQTSRDVARALQSARLCVMHSSSEGGPRMALEAMALGLPVIATRVGVMPAVIQDGVNGLLTSGHIDDLEHNLSVVLGLPDMLDRLGREARGVVEQFSRSVLVAKYAVFLQSLV
jgi:glycosyltransferase involved in cell wall biosynthesis